MTAREYRHKFYDWVAYNTWVNASGFRCCNIETLARVYTLECITVRTASHTPELVNVVGIVYIGPRENDDMVGIDVLIVQ